MRMIDIFGRRGVEDDRGQRGREERVVEQAGLLFQAGEMVVDVLRNIPCVGKLGRIPVVENAVGVAVADAIGKMPGQHEGDVFGLARLEADASAERADGRRLSATGSLRTFEAAVGDEVVPEHAERIPPAGVRPGGKSVNVGASGDKRHRAELRAGRASGLLVRHLEATERLIVHELVDGANSFAE